MSTSRGSVASAGPLLVCRPHCLEWILPWPDQYMDEKPGLPQVPIAVSCLLLSRSCENFHLSHSSRSWYSCTVCPKRSQTTPLNSPSLQRAAKGMPGSAGTSGGSSWDGLHAFLLRVFLPHASSQTFRWILELPGQNTPTHPGRPQAASVVFTLMPFSWKTSYEKFFQSVELWERWWIAPLPAQNTPSYLSGLLAATSRSPGLTFTSTSISSSSGVQSLCRPQCFRITFLSAAHQIDRYPGRPTAARRVLRLMPKASKVAYCHSPHAM
mmetsp:Transcript_89475/g.233217  ORF Transcript_89475/g.233217 Transcript_89475/m.233217 type:complete len:268 (+) Transcript_89475:1121-1924(+)